MPYETPDSHSNPTLCVSFCETAAPASSPGELEELLAATCAEAGFPHCERIYVGSYFCENYFCGLPDAFHESVRQLCRRFDLGATLVVPLVGQAFLDRTWQRINDVLGSFGDVYDEVVANDVACYLDLAAATDKRIGLGRLFSKELRDARRPQLMEAPTTPHISAEARECLGAAAQATAYDPRSTSRPLIEFDPTSAIVDVSEVAAEYPNAEIALHLPLCFATTGRNCGPASIDEPVDQKFVIGRPCGRHCLRMAQGYLTDGNVRYVKHGRTFYYENPACQIAGTKSWRIVYGAAHETMRPAFE